MKTVAEADSTQAEVQYLGISDGTKDCIVALSRILQVGPQIESARIITADEDGLRSHALLLTDGIGDQVVIPAGFASGYGGTGPHGFSFALALLHSLKIRIDEVKVSADLLQRLDRYAMSSEDLDKVLQTRPVRPSNWPVYVEDRDWQAADDGTLWERLDPFIPLALVDPRITDLARAFWQDPDRSISKAFRRLEDDVRDKTQLPNLDSSKLLSNAFSGDSPVLIWDGVSRGEQQGRAQLFTATYAAFRNPRAHHEDRVNQPIELVKEFLSVNLLFRLLRASMHRLDHEG